MLPFLSPQVLIINALLPALLLGLQPGLQMAPGSVGVVAANGAVLLVKVGFFVYLCVVFPYRNVLYFCVEATWRLRCAPASSY
jgi:hypothetical protein